jgi:hypothetical protein
MISARSTLALALAATLSVPGALAGARITVRTDLPATVVVDGKPVGKTPMQLNLLYEGQPRVEVLHKQTGMSYAYRVHSPASGMASRIINSSFQGAPPITTPIVNQVTLAAPPEPPAKVSHDDDRRVREKIRIRNTVLGGGLANAIFNHGPHRNGIFVGLFWLGLLNELLHTK